MSIHMCNIIIKGLPLVLISHIIPDLSIASLFGIPVLTEAGCKVMFEKHHCVVRYHVRVILKGIKDPITDLWTLPLENAGMTSQHVRNVLLLAAPVVANTHAHIATQIAFFTHTVHNKANSIRLAHQSLCSP
jgi:hypothetical protein